MVSGKITTTTETQTDQKSIGRRTQSERTEGSRAKLIHAATELLGANGYSGTTLVEIGRRAGVSRGLVTFHFGTKEQVMIAVVVAIRQRIQAVLDGDSSRGLDALDGLVDTYLLGDADVGVAIRAMYVIITESVTSSPGLKSAVAENNEIFREVISRSLAEAVDDNQITKPSDPKALSVVIEGVLRGVLIQYLTDPLAVELRTVASIVKRIIRDHLGRSIS
ncbi:TetR/AcrR family transcriptional regulator [Gordonia sp. HY285]|uniref:TetR/AcrR family transcriptional regulator n=1 Tax=Gordonia liuliyuniae TaxID=2911517 RepID=UPI001F3305CF|nr:TetR/AcrR family transcriptional regulator [Gordonia liuliyuniae]MCF8608936.1 TetR/AcrR family transcriptional regulator [Gordonia liuliyuniae]